jgi:hypothetical protein
MRLNSDDRRLSGAQIEGFRQALHDAFERESFVDFLCIQLDKSIDDLAAKDTYPHELRNVIKHLDEQGESAELLQGARLWRPKNLALAMFAQQFGLMPAPSLTDVFESAIRPLDPELDVRPWCARLMALIPRICRIDFPSGISSKLGTGFLVGVSTVMTSFHVMQEVLTRKIDPSRVSLRFDYQVLEDGRTFSDGVIYHLPRENWWLDYSEFSPLDGRAQSGTRLADADHLDYILLHVERHPGLDPIGATANKQPRPEQRGWIDLSSAPPVPVAGTELFILHHPAGQRLKMTLNTTSVQSVNSNCTRMLHTTNTAHGTSGAPCFTYNWEPIALHQSGDPATDQHHPAEFNQSIPLATIWKRLAQRDMLRYLGNSQQSVQIQSVAPAQALVPGPLPAHSPRLVDGDLPASTCQTRPEPAEREEESRSIEHARTCLTNAQHALQEAMALFPPAQTYILPEKCDRAIRALATMAQDIATLQTALNGAPALALIAKEHIGDIYHQLNIMLDQIEHYLLPALYQRFPGNFTRLQAALLTVERYISRKE